MKTNGSANGTSPTTDKAIRPFRSAFVASAIGFIVGLLSFNNPEAKGVVLLLAMVVAGVLWAGIFFVAVLAFQLFRKHVAKHLR